MYIHAAVYINVCFMWKHTRVNYVGNKMCASLLYIRNSEASITPRIIQKNAKKTFLSVFFNKIKKNLFIFTHIYLTSLKIFRFKSITFPFFRPIFKRPQSCVTMLRFISSFLFFLFMRLQSCITMHRELILILRIRNRKKYHLKNGFF
jgi:hypothetical protein